MTHRISFTASTAVVWPDHLTPMELRWGLDIAGLRTGRRSAAQTAGVDLRADESLLEANGGLWLIGVPYVTDTYTIGGESMTRLSVYNVEVGMDARSFIVGHRGEFAKGFRNTFVPSDCVVKI